MVTMTDDPLSSTFAALADPTRRAILARLAEGEANVSELAEPFAMSLQAISKHLKVLERAGLVSRQGRPVATVPARVRPARERAGMDRRPPTHLERPPRSARPPPPTHATFTAATHTEDEDLTMTESTTKVAAEIGEVTITREYDAPETSCSGR